VGDATIYGMSQIVSTSQILSVPAAEPDRAAAHFAAMLTYQTDVSDVHADLEAKVPGITLVDVRSEEAYRQGHVPDALHLPRAEIASRAAELVAPGTTVVTYCWGPGCNGATRGALEFARLGYAVKEMIGGFEYWAREGLPVVTESGLKRFPVDVLTAPRTVRCDC